MLKYALETAIDLLIINNLFWVTADTLK